MWSKFRRFPIAMHDPWLTVKCECVSTKWLVCVWEREKHFDPLIRKWSFLNPILIHKFMLFILFTGENRFRDGFKNENIIEKNQHRTTDYALAIKQKNDYKHIYAHGVWPTTMTGEKDEQKKKTFLCFWLEIIPWK